jgi:hypothetical protein
MLYRDRVSFQEFTAQDGTPAAFTRVATLDVISQGPSLDFLFHATYLIRVNANGEPTAEQDNIFLERQVKGIRPPSVVAH